MQIYTKFLNNKLLIKIKKNNVGENENIEIFM